MITRRGLVRRGAALVGGATMGLSASAGRADAGDKVTLLTPNGFQADFIELMNGYSGKHFAAQGLDAEIVGANGTAQTAQLLLAGRAKFARMSGLDALKLVGKLDAPLVSVATLCQASAFLFVSAPERPIAKAEDLKGKTVGIVSVGGTTDTYVDLVLHKVGLTPDDVEKRAVGNSPAAYEFVKRGALDCCVVSLPVVLALQDARQVPVSWNTDRYAPLPGQCYVTLRSVLDREPELVVRFLRGLRASVEELMTKPSQPLFQRAAGDFEIPKLGDLDAQAAILNAVIDQQWLSEGRENLLRNVPRLWREGAAATEAMGAGKLDDGARFYTNAPLDAAMKS